MKKYLDLDGLEKVAEKVNEKTPTVDALPTAASVGDIVIFSSDGGIYRYDGAQWVKTTGDADAAPMLSITWSALRSLRRGGGLIPGMQYRITDFVTTTAQADTRSAGHAFDVIVTADDTYTLNENARACMHEGDSYFSDSKLKAWKLKYCLDNDISRFAWADTSNGKGVIYRLIDEFNNDFPYDFKNIQFKRYKASGHIYRHSTSNAKYNQVSTSWKENFSDGMISTDNLPFYYLGAPVTTISGTWYDENGNAVDASALGNVYKVLDSSNNLVLGRTDEFKYFYTFSTLVDVDEEPYDTTVNVLKNIRSNFYDIYKNNSTLTLTLPNVVFFGSDCYGNTFGSSCYGNTFGSDCYGNTFGSSCYGNTFGSDCYGNTFGSDCSGNTFGSDCNSNTFGSYCSGNTFGSDCYSNTFGSYCSGNTFGSDCYSNTFGSDCYSNTFGSSCYSNTFDSDCYSNTFGSDCSGNTFGSSCNSNTFGSYCYSNTFGSYYRYNHIEAGCYYLNFSNSGISSSYIQKARVFAGTQGQSSSNKMQVALTRGWVIPYNVKQTGTGTCSISAA